MTVLRKKYGGAKTRNGPRAFWRCCLDNAALPGVHAKLQEWRWSTVQWTRENVIDQLLLLTQSSIVRADLETFDKCVADRTSVDNGGDMNMLDCAQATFVCELARISPAAALALRAEGTRGISLCRWFCC